MKNIQKLKFETIIFDLDGTLTDSAEGIINSLTYALNAKGLPVPPEKVLRSKIGPPLEESFLEFGVSPGEVNGAIELFREYYAEKGIYENKTYPGVEDCLKTLKASGARLAVATTKSEKFAKKIISRFGLDKYFEFLAGSNIDGSRTEKSELIAFALQNLGVKAGKNVIMVGDRFHDIAGAKKAGVSSAGVLYGYGGREELISAGADILIPEAAMLATLLT